MFALDKFRVCIFLVAMFATLPWAEILPQIAPVIEHAYANTSAYYYQFSTIAHVYFELFLTSLCVFWHRNAGLQWIDIAAQFAPVIERASAGGVTCYHQLTTLILNSHNIFIDLLCSFWQTRVKMAMFSKTAHPVSHIDWAHTTLAISLALCLFAIICLTVKAQHMEQRLAAIEAKQIEMQVAITKAAQSGEGNDDCIEISQRMELSESLNMLIEMVAAEFDFYTVKEKDTAVALPPYEIEDSDQTETESTLCVSDLECIGIMPAAAPEQATVLERAAEPVPTHAEIAIEADDCASTCTKSADDSGWITVGPGGKPIKGGKAVRNKSIRKRRSKGKKTSKKTSKK